jgi:hypothetical protein
MDARSNPCLETVPCGVVVVPGLVAVRHEAASDARLRPNRVARVWPEPALLIRRLVRAVRPCSAGARPQFQRPVLFGLVRWRPTSWVHKRYTARGALPDEGLDDDAAFGLDVDAARAEVGRYWAAVAVAPDLAKLTTRSSCEFVRVVQVEPYELVADGTGAVESRPYAHKGLGDRGVVSHYSASSVTTEPMSTEASRDVSAGGDRRHLLSAWEAPASASGLTWEGAGSRAAG